MIDVKRLVVKKISEGQDFYVVFINICYRALVGELNLENNEFMQWRETKKQRDGEVRTREEFISEEKAKIALLFDIKANGMRHPIKLNAEGSVEDGGHRLAIFYVLDLPYIPFECQSSAYPLISNRYFGMITLDKDLVEQRP